MPSLDCRIRYPAVPVHHLPSSTRDRRRPYRTISLRILILEPSIGMCQATLLAGHEGASLLGSRKFLKWKATRPEKCQVLTIVSVEDRTHDNWGIRMMRLLSLSCSVIFFGVSSGKPCSVTPDRLVIKPETVGENSLKHKSFHLGCSRCRSSSDDGPFRTT